MNVWKVGSRWGNLGESVLGLFLDYGIVFVGGVDDGRKQGDYKAVREGDLFLIADGATPVAIGLSKGKFQPVEASGALLRAKDRDAFFDESTVVCKAEIRLLKERPVPSWSFNSRTRFCLNHGSRDEVIACWKKFLAEEDKGAFDIQSRTVSLFPHPELDGSVFHSDISYRIPVYQRPYSWGRAELDRLFQDILKGVRDGEPLFLGTMQLSAPTPLDAVGRKRRYDVIDGQQRISTFLILITLLEKMGSQISLPTDMYSALRTLVNRGEAQKDFDEFLDADMDAIKPGDESMNPYVRNAAYLYEKLQELEGSENAETSIRHVVSCLSNNVRIVVIETHAGISKTIQIFNVINTTGLDLNGGDLFKVRLFEFLTEQRGEGREVFDQISELYGVIERRNKDLARQVTDMPEILRILQSLIIAQYDMPMELFDYSTERFWEQLFDALLGINIWPHFRADALDKIIQDQSEASPLSVASINKLIDCRYRYHQKFDSDETGLVSDVALTRFMMQSRYGWRYWYYPVIFLYQHGEDGLKEFFGELVRVSICYSLLYGKVVYEAHACIRRALKILFLSTEDAVGMLSTKRKELQAQAREIIHDGKLANMPMAKRILCRLSEYLEHTAQFEQIAPELLKNLFYERIDIEHIQAYHDADGSRREEVWKEWGPILNGIGNLAILEESINRSISNSAFDLKKDGYQKSRYGVIKNLASLSQWELQDCEARRESETEKLMDWLFPES